MGGQDEIEDGMGFSGLVDLSAKRQQKNTYKAQHSCLNCGQGWETQIPKGITIRQNNAECPTCGCKIIDVASEFERGR